MGQILFIVWGEGGGIKLQEFDKLNEIKVNYINEKKFKFLRKS